MHSHVKLRGQFCQFALALPIFLGCSNQILSQNIAKSSLTDLSRVRDHPVPLSLHFFENIKKESTLLDASFVLALPIFPDRLQSSIVGRIELNFRVRDGNGWTLDLINTNYLNRTAATNNYIKLYSPCQEKMW